MTLLEGNADLNILDYSGESPKSLAPKTWNLL